MGVFGVLKFWLVVGGHNNNFFILPSHSLFLCLSFLFISYIQITPCLDCQHFFIYMPPLLYYHHHQHHHHHTDCDIVSATVIGSRHDNYFEMRMPRLYE